MRLSIFLSLFCWMQCGRQHTHTNKCFFYIHKLQSDKKNNRYLSQVTAWVSRWINTRCTSGWWVCEENVCVDLYLSFRRVHYRLHFRSRLEWTKFHPVFADIILLIKDSNLIISSVAIEKDEYKYLMYRYWLRNFSKRKI